MKLLLTSGGITNNSIINALFSLIWKKAEDTTIVFIPTASTIETWDKSWFIKDLIDLKKLNFKSIEITDISVVNEEIRKSSIERADVLFFEGGNTYYLMDWLNKSGLAKILPKLLKDKVYVWVSAWSMVTNKDIKFKLKMRQYEENTPVVENIQCLNLVNFYIIPHLNSSYFSLRKETFIKDIVKDSTEKVYVLDDNSAIWLIPV